MRKTILLIFVLIFAVFISVSCSLTEEYDTYCEHCSIDLMYDDTVEDNYDNDYCYPCALEYLRYCYICKEYYHKDSSDSNSGCCDDCTYEYFDPCYFCGGYDCDENNAVLISINDEDYYACPFCMTSYFSNIYPLSFESCYYCDNCCELFTGRYYEYIDYFEDIYSSPDLCCEPCAIATNFEDLKK